MGQTKTRSTANVLANLVGRPTNFRRVLECRRVNAIRFFVPMRKAALVTISHIYLVTWLVGASRASIALHHIGPVAVAGDISSVNHGANSEKSPWKAQRSPRPLHGCLLLSLNSAGWSFPGPWALNDPISLCPQKDGFTTSSAQPAKLQISCTSGHEKSVG